MRKPVLLIFTNACILIVVFGLLAQSLFIVQRIALTRHVSGQVAVQRGGAGAFLPLLAGASIRSGDVVQTGAQSTAEFAWKDGTRWKIAPNSRLIIEQAQLNPAKNNEISRFRLEKGQILLRAVKPIGPNSSVEIVAANLIASARGAVLGVAIAKNTTQIHVFRGYANIFDVSYSRQVRLSRGQQVRASPLQFKSSVAPAVTLGAAEPATNPADFSAQSAFLKPEIQVEAQLLAPGFALLKGHTEAGNAVTIEGVSVPVLGTGDFVRRVKIGAAGIGWKVESSDQFGAKTTVYQNPPPVCGAEK